MAKISRKAMFRAQKVESSAFGFRQAQAERARLRRRLSAEQNHRCCYCGARMGLSPCADTSREATIEHVIPQRRGGMTNWWNTVAACRRCNTDRGHAHQGAENLVDRQAMIERKDAP